MTTTWRDPALPARFWDKVEVRESGCWAWGGATIKGGYGSFRDHRTSLPHRLAYIALVGQPPEGYEVDHLCRNPGCVNPDHLEAVTPRVNNLRSESAAAVNYRKTHCTKGHPFTNDNTRLIKSGRVCLTCQRDRAYEATVRRRAALLSVDAPEMVCACGFPTPLSREGFRRLPKVYCCACGAEMREYAPAVDIRNRKAS